MPTDEEIEAIIAEGEAGVQDLLRAYDVVEQRYFAATAKAPTDVTIITDTTNTSAVPTR